MKSRKIEASDKSGAMLKHNSFLDILLGKILLNAELPSQHFLLSKFYGHSNLNGHCNIVNIIRKFRKFLIVIKL